MSMIDSRRNPIAASSSDQTPPSSGPRCRIQTSDSSISALTLAASPVADRNPISPHTCVRLVQPTNDVRRRAVGGARLTDVLVPAHPAPGGDVRPGGRVVGLDGDRLAHRDVADVPGQVEDGQRAPPPTTVQGHSPAAPNSSRTSATTPGSTPRKSSTSASVVAWCSDTRTLPDV